MFINYCSFGLSVYFFFRHEWYCEPGSILLNFLTPAAVLLYMSVGINIVIFNPQNTIVFFDDNKLSNCPHKIKIHVSVRLLTIKISQ